MQDAKARFSELIDKAVKDGPQIVTRRGKEEAVVVSVATYRDLEQRARPSLKELLLAPEPRTDDLVPERRKHKWREIPDLD
ncbi:MAG: type II toxin-antitoxin system Phd/YefM family antitoxin [Hyphomicrobium sp.]